MPHVRAWTVVDLYSKLGGLRPLSYILVGVRVRFRVRVRVS